MVFLKSVILVLGLIHLGQGHNERVNSHQQVEVKRLMDSVITPEYFPNVRPYGVNGTDATLVTVQLHEINIIEVDEDKGRFTFQAYARKSWVDPRLAYNDTKVDYIPLKDCHSIWSPDLFFLNGIDTATSFHKSGKLARIYPNGRVFKSVRLTQTIFCPSFYNKDGTKEFICPVQIGSYGYYNDEIEVQFKEGGVTSAKEVVIPDFTFGGVTHSRCDTGAKKARTGHGDHVHACVQVEFKFTPTRR